MMEAGDGSEGSTGKRIEVSDEDRLRLERIVRAVRCEVRMVERARIVRGGGDDRWADRRAGGVFAADGGEVAWALRAVGDRGAQGTRRGQGAR
jgi:hypothetical protein